MDTPAITSTTQQTASGKASAKLSGDIESFLTLLTTQLKHQDPLEPVDSTEFTAQLAQFASVEQGIQTNANLEKLIAFNATNQALAAVSYLGKYVEATRNAFGLTETGANFAYSLPTGTEATAITIRNQQGALVRILQGETEAGKHAVQWDGRDANGMASPEGIYLFTVSAADAEGQPVDATEYATGIVDGADNSGDAVELTIDGVPVPLANVVTVRDGIQAE